MLEQQRHIICVLPPIYEHYPPCKSKKHMINLNYKIIIIRGEHICLKE